MTRLEGSGDYGQEASVPAEQTAEVAGQWNYRCDCGKRFTNTYGSGSAYCPKIRCQRVCFALSPAKGEPR